MTEGERRQLQQDRVNAEMDRRRLRRIEQQKHTQRSHTPPLDVPIVIADANCIIVTLQSTGGSNGDKDHQPSYVYTAFSLTGAPYRQNLTPLAGRKNGQHGAAAYGLGYLDASNTFQLLYAFETPATGGC